MSDRPFAVVVVDDAPDVREVVGSALRLSGRFAVVGQGGTGREAVDLAARHHPDILLLDASMPDMDGLEAIAAVREASPSTRIVILSGFEALNLEDRALQLGADRYLEKSRPLRDLAGELLSVLGGPPVATPADKLSELAEPEVVMAEHLERFRTVFDQAAIGMATLTLTGRIVRANGALALLAGVDQADLVGRPYADLAAPEDRNTLAAAVAAAARGERVAQQVEHGLAASADLRWANSTLVAVLDSKGRPLYIFAQTGDITGRRSAAEELRVSEERFRLMVESVQDYAIFRLDPDGRVTTWNLGAERMKGYRADQIIGEHFRVFFPQEAQDRRHPEHELEIARQVGRYEEEGWRVRRDGTRFWANVVITALFDHDGRLIGFAKVTRDMSERQRAQEEREASARDLAEANVELRDAALRTEDFLAITAHELQSPISAVSGASDILLDHWDRLDAAEREELLRHIATSGARMRRLLTDLLTVSRLDAGLFELQVAPVAIAPAVAEAATALGAQIELLGDGGAVALADGGRLVQILTNLLTNAAKYGRPPIAVAVTAGCPDVHLSVTDAGDGVPAELVPRLFGKFARGRAAGNGGTGLGLFIVRELAQAHGGDAWYEPAPGGGARFVALPAAT